LALGVVIGINPSVGITTALVVMFAWAFGFNQVASQIGTASSTGLRIAVRRNSSRAFSVLTFPAACFDHHSVWSRSDAPISDGTWNRQTLSGLRT
jgi:hypothetical protein